MKRQTISRLFGCFPGLILLLPLTARAQNTPQKSGDPESERVQAMIRQARQESEQFSGSSGKASDANHPTLKWAATLQPVLNRPPVVILWSKERFFAE
jgi:hypothetical protein